MEFVSDPLKMSAGVSPAVGIRRSWRDQDWPRVSGLKPSPYQGSSWKVLGKRPDLRVWMRDMSSVSSFVWVDLRFWIWRWIWDKKFLRVYLDSYTVWDLELSTKSYKYRRCLFLGDLNRISSRKGRLIDSGFQSRPPQFQSMASSGGWGDKGIVAKTVTHPKPPGGAADDLVVTIVEPQGNTSNQVQIAASPAVQNQTSTKQFLTHLMGAPSTSGTSLASGPAAYTEGDIQEEDEEEAIEVQIDDDEVQLAGQWTVLARYYSLRTPNHTALFEDMSRAWRLRTDMSYKSLRDNMFIVTFGSQGDYNFVLQGGPWLHRGDALLVAKFDGITSPSEVPLEFVPIWVRIYDLPLALMTKARGELYGSKLGKVKEVDVGEDGRNKHDFFHIRVNIPVNRPLKTSLAMKINVKGNEVVRRFDLRYERVPYFCFICSYIGHSNKDCDKRIPNTDHPFRLSADLRCSPLKPFERKISTVRGVQRSGVVRNLAFRGAGSASSSSSKHKQTSQDDWAIPDRVDAHDGFEARENTGDESVDEQLAVHAHKMKMSVETYQSGMMVGSTQRKQNAETSGGLENESSSREMIPAIQKLHEPASFGGDSSDIFSESIKNQATDGGMTRVEGLVQQALVIYEKASGTGHDGEKEPEKLGRALKRSRKTEADSKMVDMEATSVGATGELTGSDIRARQEK